MKKFNYLREFTSEELFLDESETALILKFIFKKADHELIDQLPMSDYLRGFAQALLVEAIDASYSVGFIQALFESSANPSKGAISVIKKFASKSAKHWYKNLNATDLQNVRIYDFVRDEIAARYRYKLYDFLGGLEDSSNIGAFVFYSAPKFKNVKRVV